MKDKYCIPAYNPKRLCWECATCKQRMYSVNEIRKCDLMGFFNGFMNK